VVVNASHFKVLPCFNEGDEGKAKKIKLAYFESLNQLLGAEGLVAPKVTLGAQLREFDRVVATFT